MNRSITALALVAAVCQSALAADPVQASIDWLLSLKLADMPPDDAPIVRVPVSATRSEGRPWQFEYSLGFLEMNDGKHYRVRLLNFGVLEADNGNWQQNGLKIEDEVKRVSATDAVAHWCDTSSAHGAMSEFTKITLFAAVLQKRGETAAAAELIRQARELSPAVWPADGNFRETLKRQIAEALLRAVSADFADTEMPRKQLEARLSEIARHFPGTASAAKAETALIGLRKVIEGEHISNPDLNADGLAKLPLKERVAALIQRLPEQTGRQMIMPGMCDVFADDPAVWHMYLPDFPGAPKIAITPAGKLYQIGLDAVPQLLVAIDDHRPTRAVGMGQVNQQRSAVLDVGDCALQILQRLSGRSFQSQGGLPSNPDSIRAQMKRNAEAWWNTVESGQEAEILDKEISSGSREGSPERLAAIAPERVVPAIERGLVNAADSWRVDSLLRGLMMVNSEPARALLRKTVTQGRKLSTRMEAAEYVNMGDCNFNGKQVSAFSEGDQRMARLAMLLEWKNFPDSAEKHDSHRGSELADLITKLALRDTLMLPAIRAELPRHMPSLRARVIFSLGNSFPLPPGDTRPPRDAATAVERFLAEQLDDVDYTPEIYPKDASNARRRTARVADIAADLLHKIWPDRYAFTWKEKREDIENARLACLHAWRTAQGPAQAGPVAHEAAKTHDPNVVTSVVIAKISQPLPAVLQPQVEAWLEKPLNVDALVQFLADFAEENSDDSRSIALTARRDARGAGIVIELMILPGQPTTRNPNYSHDVIAGGKKLSGEPYRIEHEIARRPDGYGNLKSEIREALAAAADVALFIRVVRLGQAASAP